MREGFTGAIDYLKILEQKIASMETLVNGLMEKQELPEIQELKHYQVCYFSFHITILQVPSWKVIDRISLLQICLLDIIPEADQNVYLSIIL